jgi:hypothetical protein
VGGVTTVKAGFRELQSPTLNKAGNTDCFASGTFWFAPQTGDVVQADIVCVHGLASTDPMTVRYQKEGRFGLWLPSELIERPHRVMSLGSKWVEARCHYSNYRRFETGAKLILTPKRP